MLAVVPAAAVDAALEALGGAGVEAWPVGEIEAGTGRVDVRF
jgi:phosphoribosylaminoimidazole (AIR) synthetase